MIILFHFIYRVSQKNLRNLKSNNNCKYYRFVMSDSSLERGKLGDSNILLNLLFIFKMASISINNKLTSFFKIHKSGHQNFFVYFFDFSYNIRHSIINTCW